MGHTLERAAEMLPTFLVIGLILGLVVGRHHRVLIGVTGLVGLVSVLLISRLNNDPEDWDERCGTASSVAVSWC